MDKKYVLEDTIKDEIIATNDNIDELPEIPHTLIKVKCDICGEYEYLTDIVEVDDTIYCETCRDYHLAYCERCGTYHDLDECLSVHVCWNGTETWCEECRTNHATQCYECGEIFDDNYFSLINCHGNYYCDNCSDYIYYCDGCGEYYFDYEGTYCEEDDQWYCDNCYHDLWGNCSDRITGYHHRPNMRYYEDKDNYYDDNPNFKGFGIELEIDHTTHMHEQEAVDHLNNILGDHVYYNRDGSLDYGFEIISQPHTRNALMSLDWNTALTKLVSLGYRSHDLKTCGLHMHVSRLMFGDTEQERTENIAKIIQFYGLFWNDILKFSRRTENQADRWAKKYIMGHDKNEAKSISENNAGRYRYYAVNLANNNTVEFRLMRGTLNTTTFNATLDFLMTVAENAKNVTNVTSLKQWLHGIADTTKEYMKHRKCFGYSNNQTTENEQGDAE